MYKKTFHGGVHPYDGKEFARDIPFQTWLPKGDLVFHLNQHTGSKRRQCTGGTDHRRSGWLCIS